MLSLRPRTLKFKFILYMGLVIALFVGVLFYWIFQHSRAGVISQLDLQAKALLQQIIITRSWIADHGGLFVAQGKNVEANPFLPDTDIQDKQGKTYHFRNPAMVTREISEYANTIGLYRFRLTSLKLKNPENEPLPFERESLLFFQNKGYEATKSGLASEGYDQGAKVYRRIIPLRVDESCLECHSDQGYSVGDIRGGLSVFLPMTDALKTIKFYGMILIISGLAIIGIVSGVIYILLRTLVLKPVEHLHHVAQRLIDGEYSVRAQLMTDDEFEAFAHAFNKMNDRLKQGYEGVIKSLVAAVDARDPYTRGHTARVAHYAVAIAEEMGLQDEKVAEIELGAILHDIGKIGIADKILGKSTPLVDEETQQMETHPQKGAVIVKDVDFLHCAIPAILCHHERLDGNGYPHALQGDEIPLSARIIAVADAFDAMTTDRPYSKALQKREAIEEINKQAGKQFDAEVARAFQVVMQRKLNENGPDNGTGNGKST